MMPTSFAEKTAARSGVEAGSWRSIGLVYLYSVLTAASISKLVPIAGDLERAFGATPQGLGIAISLISVSSAFAATIGGAIVDRVGPRPAIVVTSGIVVVANIVEFFSNSMSMLYVARLIEGIEYIGIITAAPALIMATTSGKRRVRAMSVWSTYTPAGVALGMLMAVPFAGTSAWRWTFALHGGLFAAAACLGGLLPETRRTAATESRSRRSRVTELLSSYREAGPLRLSLANVLLVSIGLGTSVVVPAYFAQTHHVSIATSSTIAAFANAAMILGGLLAGVLLSRHIRPFTLYVALALGGIISGVLLYAPRVSFPLAIAMFSVWLLTTGAATAVIMSLLPQVVRDPSRGAAASGLLAQVMAVGTFVTPAIYYSLLAKGNWLHFIAMIIGGWVASVAFLPAWGRSHRSARQAAAN